METRQTKRRRLSQRALEAPTTVHTPLYLDALPQDALTVILRHLSTRPYANNWHCYVDPREALSILECGGSLTGVARSMFTSLDLLVAEEAREAAFSALHTSSLALFKKLLIEQGPRLTKLSFASAPSRFLRPEHQFGFANGAYFEYCCQLRELTIADFSIWREQEPLSLEPILTACGGVLQKLTILGNTHLHTAFVDSVMRHCRALESLSLSQETVNIKMNLFWQVVGLKLKRLSCFPPCSPNKCRSALLPISRYCKKLEDVEITGHMRTIPSLNFYYEMGKRLRVLHFQSSCAMPTPDEFEKILENCPHAMVDIYIRRNGEELLRVLGDRVRNLRLRCIQTPSDEFVDIADRLTSLCELTVTAMNNTSVKFARALFNAPKPNLEVLSLPCVDMFDPLNEGADEFNLLAELGRKACALREFSFSSWIKFDFQAFVSVINANRQLRRLTAVCRRNTYTKEVLLSHIKEVVCALVKHESIRELGIHLFLKNLSSKEISDAYVPLRGRELNVIMGNVQYLPTYSQLS